MKKIIKLVRLILFVPAMILGELLAVIATAIWNIPLSLLGWVNGLLGDWSLWGLIFGGQDMTTDILYGLSSGIFTSAIGLYLGISVFPYPKYRKKVAYFLALYLLVGFSFSNQMAVGYNAYEFASKIIGILIGSLVIIRMLKDGGQHNELFNFIDKIIEDNLPTDKVVDESTEQQKAEIRSLPTHPTNSMQALSGEEIAKEPQSKRVEVVRTGSLQRKSSNELAGIAVQIVKIGQENSFPKEGRDKLNAIRAELVDRKVRREKYFLQRKVETTQTEIAELEDMLKEFGDMQKELEKSMEEKALVAKDFTKQASNTKYG